MNRVRQALQDEGGPLLGAAVYTYNPVFVEIAGFLGFHVIWIEMEHAHISFAQAADLCRIAAGVGLLSMIRIPDTRRESVLKAAECGPDIIDLPMGNSPETLRELVSHARYKPDGNRGFFGSSRAMKYGVIDSIVEQQEVLNDSLCLLSQVETREAVGRVEELASVDGVDGIFIGPGDLSASLGVTGDINHVSVRNAIEKTIRVAKEQGKLVALAIPPQDASQWMNKGVDVFFSGSDISCMKHGAQDILNDLRACAEVTVHRS